MGVEVPAQGGLWRELDDLLDAEELAETFLTPRRMTQAKSGASA